MKKMSMRSLLTISLMMIIIASFAQRDMVIIKPGPDLGKDAYINSFYDDRPGDRHSFIASAWTYDGEFRVGRSLIELKLPQLPETYYNLKAYMSFYHDPVAHHEGHTGDNACKLERIIAPWDEYEVGWYNQPEVTSEHAVSIPMSTSPTQNYTVDVTQLVMDMYANPDNSFGFRLSLETEELYRSMVFSSSDHEDPALWPELIVVYDLDTCIGPVNEFTYAYNGLQVLFNYDDPSINYIDWNFGNGYGCYIEDPVYTFNEPGLYNVCLKVGNECDTIEICQQIPVCLPLNAMFTYEIDGLHVDFTNQSVGAIDFNWTFGNGFYANVENPEFIYETPGDYEVCLNVANLCAAEAYCELITLTDSAGYNGNPLSLNDKSQLENSLSIYPNPAKETVNLQFEDVIASNIQIVNSLGFIVKDVNLASITNDYRLSLQGIRAGIYFIRVYTDKGIIIKRLLIV